LNKKQGREMSLGAYKDKKITFVVGAGASLPFITNGDICLNTYYLTEQISDRDRWITIYDEFKNGIPSKKFPDYNFNVSIDDILSLIERLKVINEIGIPSQIQKRVSFPLPQKIDDIYGISQVNFEHILYLLDKVCNCLNDRKNSIDNILFDLWIGEDKQRQILQSKKGWNYVPYLCREVLVKAILDLWDAAERKKAIEDNKQFFASVLKNFKAVSIYSLNYDPLLYEAVKQIRVKGHKRNHEIEKILKTGFSDGNCFNPKEFYLSDNVIAFLHGHIGFISKGGKDSMYFDDKYSNAQQERLKYVASGGVDYFRWGRKGIHYNVSITSGFEKFESFYENPYACYIQRFSDDIMESEYVIFIGSGLGDYHINLFLTNAWRLANGYAEEPQNLLGLRKLGVGRKKTIIVTLGQATEGLLNLLGLTDIGKRIYDLLKENISWIGETADGSLKNNGYANINEGLFLYLNGTRKFFSEIWSINDLF
jgi:hypothetical protein